MKLETHRATIDTTYDTSLLTPRYMMSNFYPRLLAAAAALAAISLSAPAFANTPISQSNDGVEERRTDRSTPSGARVLRRTIFDQGRWSIGADALFSMTSTRVDLLDGSEATDSTFFFRVAPQVSVNVLENFEVGLITGVVARRLAREDSDSATDVALTVQPMARYHIPATLHLAIYGQVAPGYYRGRATRDLDVNETLREDQRTSTQGFILSVGTGISYRLSNGLQIRFGLNFNGIWGQERIEIELLNVDESFFTATTNLGSTAGLRYTF